MKRVWSLVEATGYNAETGEPRTSSLICGEEGKVTLIEVPLHLGQFILDALNEKEQREAGGSGGEWCQHVPRHEPRDFVQHLQMIAEETAPA